MSYQKHWTITFILVVADVTAIYILFQAAIWLRGILIGSGTLLETIAQMTQLGILFCVGVFFSLGLYPGYGLTAVKELERMENAIALAFFLLATVSYLSKTYQIFSRFILLEAWILCSIFLPIVHFILRNLLCRVPWYGVPVVVFGTGLWAERVENSIRRVRRLGWKVQAVFPNDAIKGPEVGRLKSQVAILAASKNDDVEVLARVLSQHFRRVVLLWERNSAGSLWVEPRDLDGQLGLEFHYHLLSRRNRWFKQAVDWLGGGLLMVILGPVLGVIAILVALDSRGPIFFRQNRLGKDHKTISILKFRTMVADAEARLAGILKADPVAREEYKVFHKLSADPRVTRVGNWLRRFSLDELPQIINVILGEMSLVGPRAYMVSELDDIGEYAPIILRVKPGMTGWWQVLGRHTTSFDERLKMDEYYISNWSIWMDVYVLLKTVGVVLSGKGV